MKHLSFEQLKILAKHPRTRPALVLTGTLCLTGLMLYEINKHKQKLSAGYEPVAVLCVKHALPSGHILNTHDVYTQLIPQIYVAPSFIKEDELGIAVGKKLLRGVQPGDLLSWPDLHHDPRAASHLSAEIPKGYRAISVSVSEESSLGHHIQRDDRVDLMIQATKQASEDAATITLLQNILVVDVGHFNEVDKHLNYTVITLLVTPQDAAMISHAKQFGSLQFILRHKDDTEMATDSIVLPHDTFTRKAFDSKHSEPSIEIIRPTLSNSRNSL